MSDSKKTIRKRKQNESEYNKDLLIVSEDILIEYIRRLIAALKKIGKKDLNQTWRRVLLNFINSSMWRNQIDVNQPYVIFMILGYLSFWKND